jgi:predicted RecA/RadA family phage recombinase
MAQEAVIVIALGDTEEAVLSAAATPGKVVQTPDLLAAVVQGVGPYASGETVPVLVDAIVDLPVATGTTFTNGVAVEWDDTNNLVVAATAGTFKLGQAYGAKASGPTRMKVRLNRYKL